MVSQVSSSSVFLVAFDQLCSQHTNAKSKILEYLKYYGGPNSNLLSQFPDHYPFTYDEGTAQEDAANIYDALTQTSTTTDILVTDNNMDFIVKMKVFEAVDLT